MKNNEKHRKTGLDGRRFDGDVQRIDGKAQRVSKGTTPKQDDYRPPTAIYQPPRAPKTGEKLKTRFSQKRFFLNFKLNLGGLGVSGGRGGGPYEAIPSNFGRVWSYMAWGKSNFMFFGNIVNSLHHQIPANWSSGLQIVSKPGYHLRSCKTN